MTITILRREIDSGSRGSPATDFPPTPLDLIALTPLTERTSGSPDVIIGLIDGPVLMDHPDLATAHVREIPADASGFCTHAGSAACVHGTFVAGILAAKRGTAAPAICPGCSLLVRPIFAEATPATGEMPRATAAELAQAILDCLDAGARIINISAALRPGRITNEHALTAALNQAVQRHVIVIAAAGNHRTVGGTAITAHPSVIPVVSCDQRGRPSDQSNLSSSIGRRGLSAPGDRITSLGVDGNTLTLSGTSTAVPFVTGTVALLWSEFPDASVVAIKLAVTRPDFGRRNTVVPPLLDASRSYAALLTTTRKGRELS
jgi:subtilisin family serine protease